MAVELNKKRTYFVSPSTGDEHNDGLTASTPFKHMQHVLRATSMLNKSTVIRIVMVGNHSDYDIEMTISDLESTLEPVPERIPTHYVVYVDGIDGKDARNGGTQGTAFATIDRVNTFCKSCDDDSKITIRFQRPVAFDMSVAAAQSFIENVAEVEWGEYSQFALAANQGTPSEFNYRETYRKLTVQQHTELLMYIANRIAEAFAKQQNLFVQQNEYTTLEGTHGIDIVMCRVTPDSILHGLQLESHYLVAKQIQIVDVCAKADCIKVSVLAFNPDSYMLYCECIEDHGIQFKDMLDDDLVDNEWSKVWSVLDYTDLESCIEWLDSIIYVQPTQPTQHLDD